MRKKNMYAEKKLIFKKEKMPEKVISKIACPDGEYWYDYACFMLLHIIL